MRFVLYLFFASLSILFLRCSSVQSLNSFNNDYMPMAIGNKWFYNVHSSNVEASSKISIINEILSIETIEGNKYFKVKKEKVGTNMPYYYHQRISNDTLYTLNYDDKRNKYLERITAIFNLDSSEIANIKLNIEEANPESEVERLPTRNRYSIKTVNKEDNIIELFTNVGGADGNYTEIYKRGIGMIKSKNDWGIIIELVDYEFYY